MLAGCASGKVEDGDSRELVEWRRVSVEISKALNGSRFSSAEKVECAEKSGVSRYLPELTAWFHNGMLFSRVACSDRMEPVLDPVAEAMDVSKDGRRLRYNDKILLLETRSQP